MRRDVYDLYSPAIGASGSVIAYGHWGRPLLVFPSEQGRAVDYENNGMVGAVSWLIDAGRVKLYCVDSSTRKPGRARTCRSRNGRLVTVPTSRGSSIRSCRSSTTTAAARSRS